MAVFGATGGNPSGSRPNFFGRQHLTFDKGGKCIGNFRGIVRFGKGWCGRKAWCAFKRVVGVTVFGATGGNPSGSRPNFFGRQHLTFDKGRAWMPEVERPEFRKDAKPTERSYGKCIGNFRGIVRFWEGWCGASGGSAFKRAVGVTVFGATGGASSLPYEKRW